jgi:MYXO-CTERM domain-containing protein
MRCLTAAALAVLLSSSLAQANGRPPLTNGVDLSNQPQSLYIATTFGLLISHDDGCTFNWVCEGNIGYGGEFDPNYAIGADGTIFATTFFGLRASRDGGCSFQTVTAEIFVDALDIGPTGEVWIATADSTKANEIFRSTDNGVNFTPVGGQAATVLWKSVKVAPSNAQIVYASGFEAGQTQTPHLLRSIDGGTSWTPSELADVKFGGSPVLRVLAVDPTNPDVIFVKSENANTPFGDLLYRSTDGGATLTEVLAVSDQIRNVVLLDANTVLVTAQIGGTFRSTDAGATFAPLPGAPQLACLTKRADGSLIGCGANWDPDFMAVARSTDNGATWQKVWRFVELAGPLQCPAGTAEADTCAPQYENLKAQFGASGPTCGDNIVPPDATEVPPGGGGGCCDSNQSTPVWWVSVLGVALLLVRRRRR